MFNHLFTRWHHKDSELIDRLIGNDGVGLSDPAAPTNRSTVRFLPRKSRRTRSVDTRQKEKQILDSILGPKVYDRRIRPMGKSEPELYNHTGTCTLSLTEMLTCRFEALAIVDRFSLYHRNVSIHIE